MRYVVIIMYIQYLTNVYTFFYICNYTLSSIEKPKFRSIQELRTQKHSFLEATQRSKIKEKVSI